MVFGRFSLKPIQQETNQDFPRLNVLVVGLESHLKLRTADGMVEALLPNTPVQTKLRWVGGLATALDGSFSEGLNDG